MLFYQVVVMKNSQNMVWIDWWKDSQLDTDTTDPKTMAVARNYIALVAIKPNPPIKMAWMQQ